MTSLPFVMAALDDDEKGTAYLGSLARHLDQVLARPDVIAFIDGSQNTFIRTVYEIIGNYSSHYVDEKQRNNYEQYAAVEEAAERHRLASQWLMLVGALLGIFVSLTVLIVLFRIERHIRSLATQRRAAPAANAGPVAGNTP